VDVESLQRSLHDALQHTASTPLATPVHPATSTTGTASPFVLQPTVSLALSTTLEQNFKILSEFSKSEYLKWHPIFDSYQTQGGIRPLTQCMEPTVQNTFMYTLKLDRPSFFATSLGALHLLIQSHFKLNVVENYCALLVPMTNKAQFDERACDLYISRVVNLLVTYPLIFDVSNGGVSKQNSQKLMFMVSFQFHYLMMSAQKALKPSMTL
jgi:hypothetical protein